MFLFIAVLLLFDKICKNGNIALNEQADFIAVLKVISNIKANPRSKHTFVLCSGWQNLKNIPNPKI